MIRCLRLKVEGALEQIFTMAGLNIRDLLRDILIRWRDENYLGMVEGAGMFIEEIHPEGFSLYVHLDVRAVCLLEAIVQHLTNAIICSLAVEFDHATGGERVHLIDLYFEVLDNLLE
ncbi:control protein E4orf3 [Human adenovirus 2]|nr:control protein E4orf3 [Human adenovirus 2]